MVQNSHHLLFFFKEWANRHHILVQYISTLANHQNGFVERSIGPLEDVLDMNMFGSLREGYHS